MNDRRFISCQRFWTPLQKLSKMAVTDQDAHGHGRFNVVSIKIKASPAMLDRLMMTAPYLFIPCDVNSELRPEWFISTKVKVDLNISGRRWQSYHNIMQCFFVWIIEWENTHCPPSALFHITWPLISLRLGTNMEMIFCYQFFFFAKRTYHRERGKSRCLLALPRVIHLSSFDHFFLSICTSTNWKKKQHSSGNETLRIRNNLKDFKVINSGCIIRLQFAGIKKKQVLTRALSSFNHVFVPSRAVKWFEGRNYRS